MIVIGSGAYYLGTFQNKPTLSNIAASSSPSNITTEATPLPVTTANTQKEYKTRYFDITDNFWEEEKYPIEITQVPDGSLIPISCTDTYSGYGKDYTSYDEKTQNSKPLTDSSILNHIQALTKKYEGKIVTQIFSCSPELGKTVIFYSLGPCGGGCVGMPYVGVVDGSNINEVANVSEDGAYFGCRQPLQLTKDNMFYFQCGAGDGPSATATIYKLSLNNLTLSKIRHCITSTDETGKPYSRCE